MFTVALTFAGLFGFGLSEISIPFKHLAGPPSSFDVHRPPSPDSARIGVHSYTEFVAVKPSAQNPSKALKYTIYTDSQSQFGFSVNYPVPNVFEVSLADSKGRVIDLANRTVDAVNPLGLSDTNALATPTKWYFIDRSATFDGMPAGEYTVTLVPTNVTAMMWDDAQIVVWNEATLQAVSALTTYDLSVGDDFGFFAWMGAGDEPVDEAVGIFSVPYTVATQRRLAAARGRSVRRIADSTPSNSSSFAATYSAAVTDERPRAWRHVAPPSAAAALTPRSTVRATVHSASVLVRSPDATESVHPMADDGMGGDIIPSPFPAAAGESSLAALARTRGHGGSYDAVAEDGVWSVRIAPKMAGEYVAKVLLEGVDGNGMKFKRSISNVFWVVNDTADIVGRSGVAHPSVSSRAAKEGRAKTRTMALVSEPRAAAVSEESGAFTLHSDPLHHSVVTLEEANDSVDVCIFVANASLPKYVVYTELYGEGGKTPVGWFGGMSLVWEGKFEGDDAAKQYVYVSVDGSWLMGQKGPFVLKNTFVRDPDTQASVSARAEAITLPPSFDIAAAAAAAAAHRGAVADDVVLAAATAAAEKMGVTELSAEVSARLTTSVAAIYGRPPASLYGGVFASPRREQTALDRSETLRADVVALAKSQSLGQGTKMMETISSAVSSLREDGDHGTLLTHGYCSDVNPFLKEGILFTHNPAFFLDPMASRSNDDFAQRLVQFAAQKKLSAYSIIGHSQGGVAATHVANFYWSGTDRAALPRLSLEAPRAVPVYPLGYRGRYGARSTSLVDAAGEVLPSQAHALETPEMWLIMTIGTPYHGNSGAGNWAAAAKAFNVGCGRCADLAPDGAAVWVSSIVDATRSRVHYATTTYKQHKTLGDYCNLAVQAVLQWPNDGTAELSKTNLEGGTYLGNLEKQSVVSDVAHRGPWCHTVDMRYEAQYYFEQRNTLFNSHVE